jgi:hypothetical protein
MRAVAREVGEDSKAYLRHLELADLYLKSDCPETRPGESTIAAHGSSKSID